ncbi:tautomerase [Haloprofundus sp. MHR1]|uniref:tautomerase n=1 Tax=Haloprofundus sp. MHR1 TaxID=2572921 RepID=UPI0010BE608D|nr:tautomerase [Haloprofundus sp. MHR1]QCJ48169.1 tautomerase [Haloprofundus sp. MHR1]
MPSLALDTTYEPADDERRACTESLTELYAEKMSTTAGHVAVVVREHPPTAMSLGRAVDGPIAVLNADIRRGRSFERRRAFALAVVDWLEAAWGVPRPNAKVVFTEHEGHDLMGADRVGGEWSPEEEQ